MYRNNSYTLDRSYLTSTIRPVLAVLLGILLYLPGKAQLKGALDYDGVDDYSLLPNGIVSSLNGDYTIEAWVYWRGGDAFQRVFDFGNSQSQYMYISPDHGTLQYCFIINDGNGEQAVSSGVNLSINTWHHIAIVYTNANTTGALYLDGTVIASNPAITMHPRTMGSTVHNYIGKSNWPDPYFNGVIDEFRISSVARYSTNFTPLPSEFAPDVNTIALYHFDEGIGPIFADATSSHFDGTRGPTVSAESSDPSWTNLTPLPVGLLNFSGRVENGGVRLNWQTVSEQNNMGFYIERAFDGGASGGTTGGGPGGASGGAGFRDVGFVAGTGLSLSSSIVNYSFLDEGVFASAVTYRLRQTDLDGKVTYSPLVRVNFSLDETKVYLNGSSLMVSSPKAVKRVIVYSYVGQVLIEKLGDSKVVDVGMLQRGAYIATIELMNGASISSRFVK